jgi:4-amino-4-deoxy-L-arabinose transferase-like glycosyltransferase
VIESPETPAAAPPGREALRRLRAAVDATGRRLGAFPPLAVLGAFALVQWAALAAVALRTVHDGWVYDTGSRPSSGVVSALPAIVVGQTLVLLPLALWLVYAVADRLAGRVFAAWAAAVWVLLPYAGYAFSTGGYRHTYADGFLTHVLGLTADPAFPALLAFLGSGYLALRALSTARWAPVAAVALASSAVGAAFVPRAALVAVAPAAVLIVGGRRAHAAAAAAGLALTLLLVGIAVGVGLLDGPFAQLGLHAPSGALASLSENFWSGRVLEWLTIAGIIGALRRGRAAGVFVAAASLLAFLSINAVPPHTTPAVAHLVMLHDTLPAWFATAITIAAIPLLAPRGHANRPARVTLAAIGLRLEQPVGLAWPDVLRKRRTVRVAAEEADRAVATPLWAALAISVLFVVITFVGIWNAAHYPVILGYDAQEHMTYADQLIHQGTIPSSTQGGEYYTPPGYYAVAGAATWVGGKLGMANPHQAAQYLNVPFVLATAFLLLVLARLLFPRRPVLWVAALGFFAFLPVVAKTAAMFHPETLNMLVSTGAVTLAVWMLVRRRFELRFFLLLGLLLGAGQLIRASSLFTFGAVAIAFLTALTSSRLRQRMPLKKIGLAIVAAVLVTSPWYARQILNYHEQGALLQPGSLHSILHPHYAGEGPRPPFFGIALNDILNRPVRPFYMNQAPSETYTEIWGDWTGNFAWSGYSEGPWPKALAVLQDQSKIGVLPTLLALAGWLGMVALVVARRLERIPFLPVVLLPLLAVGGYLVRSYDNMTPDGDLFKASYLLTTAPIWALAFGLAFSWLARWRTLALTLAFVLVVCGVLELRFMLYGIRDHNVIF